ncbi:MAG: hypothetical protein M3O26_15705 [Pseudomonadota bacterium]|nr:hypothetical protein [Pseudomonadota bacterium]
MPPNQLSTGRDLTAPDAGRPDAAARERAEETSEEEVEITPKMIREGLRVFQENWPGDQDVGSREWFAENVLTRIYAEMERARRESTAQACKRVSKEHGSLRLR